MRINKIDKCEVCNGTNIGTSLFVQGCNFHCDGCFNSETWAYDAGTEFTDKEIDDIINNLSKPYIKRISILGGEPLCDENVLAVQLLINTIRNEYGDNKKIWIYSGYTYEQIMNEKESDNLIEDLCIEARKGCISLCDVFVDGRFEKDKKDLSLAFRGSSNQRLIDMKATLHSDGVVQYELK